MKKAAIIVCAAIYALAIIIVAFLGYQAEIHNPPVYADEIVMNYETMPYNYVKNGVIVYTIAEVNQDEQSSNDTLQYKYEVHIHEYEYLYEVLGGQMQVKAKPISYKIDEETGLPKEPDELGLTYFINNDRVQVDNEGNIKFFDMRTYGSYDLIIRTKDTSDLTIYVRIYW